MASVGPILLAHYVVLQRLHHASPQPQLELTLSPSSTPPSSSTPWTRGLHPTRVLLVRHHTPPTVCCTRPREPRTARLCPRRASSAPPILAQPCHYRRHIPTPRITRPLHSTARSCTLFKPTKSESMSAPFPLLYKHASHTGSVQHA